MCRVWDRDVFPSVIDVGPEEVLRRKILGDVYTDALVDLAVNVLMVLMQALCFRRAKLDVFDRPSPPLREKKPHAIVQRRL